MTDLASPHDALTPDVGRLRELADDLEADGQAALAEVVRRAADALASEQTAPPGESRPAPPQRERPR